MKNKTLQFLVANIDQVQLWSTSIEDYLQDLMLNGKLDIDQKHFDFLLKASQRSPKEVQVVWTLLDDTINVRFTWKIGENEDSFKTMFHPIVLN